MLPNKDLSLNDIVAAAKKMKELFPEPIDDCMWVSKGTLEAIKRCFTVKIERPKYKVSDVLTVSFDGMQIFESDDVLDHVFETGTYELVDGVVKKVVRHRGRIGS